MFMAKMLKYIYLYKEHLFKSHFIKKQRTLKLVYQHNNINYILF